MCILRASVCVCFRAFDAKVIGSDIGYCMFGDTVSEDLKAIKKWYVSFYGIKAVNKKEVT